MDRTTLIIVLIVVLIVMNMIGSSSEEHFSTRKCNKEYSTSAPFGACPIQCQNIGTHRHDGKTTFSCKK